MKPLTTKVYLTDQKKYYIIYSRVYIMYTICGYFEEDSYDQKCADPPD